MDNTTPTDPLDTRTRANLSYIFTIGSLLMLCYILYMWGAKTEILTLIIGLISGTLLGSVSGVFFGGGPSAKKPDTSTPVTGDNTTVVNNPPPATPPTTG